MKFPNYNHKQEVWNTLTHLVGFIFAVSLLIFFVVFEIKNHIPFSSFYPFYIYVFTMGIVFFVSSFYHSRPLNSRPRALWRVVDHADIFLFVAGTYTPISLLAVNNSTVSLSLIIIEWGLALIGILLTVFGFNHKSIEVIAYIIYLLAGWALAFIYPFIKCIEFNIFIWVLLGGIIYTGGAIIYGIGKKIIWLHTVFHVFIVLGAVLQFIGIYFIL